MTPPDLARPMFAGMPIFSSPFVPDTVPKLSLSPECPVSDKFRAEFNKWLLDTFGSKRIVYFIGADFGTLHHDRPRRAG